MSRAEILILLIPAAYLVGSIPFGLIVGKAKGIDPRQAGSRNIGATNLGRLLGVKYFLIVFLLDLLKGTICTAAAGATLNFAAGDRMEYTLWGLVGFAAFAGHLMSVFLKFKGGKGVATALGVVLGIFPYFTLSGSAAFLVWLIVLGIWRYISVASIVAAVAFPVSYIVMGMTLSWPIAGAQLPLLIFSMLVPVLIIYKHRANISRLRAGTELRISQRNADVVPEISKQEYLK
jgi:acyl phosphate:glycerol-3-phosphate acyltransferase